MKKTLLLLLSLAFLVFGVVGCMVPSEPESSSGTESVGTSVETCAHVKVKTEAVAAACEVPGNTEYWTCEKCGKYFADAEATEEIALESTVIAALGHEYADEYTCHDRTCVREGGGHVEEATTEHDMRFFSTTATCTEGGTTYYECACGETDSREEGPLGHQFENYVNNEDATCEEDSTETAVCARGCGATDTRTAVGTALGHTPAAESAVVTPATCTENGYTTYTCGDCGKPYQAEFVKALGHDLSVEVSVAHTCEHGTITGLACSRCDYAETEEAEDKHFMANYSESATCEYGTTTGLKCTECGYAEVEQADDRAAHEFGSDGVCTLCGKPFEEANIFVLTEKAYTAERKNGTWIFTANEKVLGNNQTFDFTITAEGVNAYLAAGYSGMTLLFGRKAPNMATQFRIGEYLNNKEYKAELVFEKDKAVTISGLKIQTISSWYGLPADGGLVWIAADGFSLTATPTVTYSYDNPFSWISATEKFRYENGEYVFASAKEQTEYAIKLDGQLITALKASAAGYDAVKFTLTLPDAYNGTMGIKLPNGGWSWLKTSTAGIYALDTMTESGFTVIACYGSGTGTAAGFMLKVEPIDMTQAENWFTPEVTCVKVGENSFDFTTDNTLKVVLTMNRAALSYLASKGYEAVRITYWSKDDTPITLGIAVDNNIKGYTDDTAPQYQEFSVANPFVIKAVYAKKDGIDGFNFKFAAIDYDDASSWFVAQVPCVKVGENSFDFTTDNALKTVLTMNSYALSYLTAKGYDAIRITYWGKNDTPINLAIAVDNNITGWTNYAAAKSQDFDITNGVFFIKANYGVKDGIDGFNFKFEAIDNDAA